MQDERSWPFAQAPSDVPSARWTVGKSVDVRIGREWHRARVLAVREDQVLVEYLGRGIRRWVAASSLERVPKGER